jgi:peptidoglycan hydrolase CwlO-like protein
MSIKVNMIEPNEDVSTLDKDVAENYQRMSQQLRQKAELGAKLKRRRDELLLDKIRQSGKNDLYDQIERAGADFDEMSQDLQYKIGELTGNLEDVLSKIDDQIARLES